MVPPMTESQNEDGVTLFLRLGVVTGMLLLSASVTVS